jgi:peptide/nickel transport system permease protein
LIISIIIFFAILFLSKLVPPGRKRIAFPLYTLFRNITEWFSSLPRLIIIVTLSAFIQPSLFGLIIIIGVTSWSDIARSISAIVLSVREREYILAARAIGLNDIRLISLHILPNLIRPLLSLLLFTVAATIITEAGLSFLGLGVPAGIVSWGQILAEGRESFRSWWLIVFPGIAITVLLSALQNLAENYKVTVNNF